MPARKDPNAPRPIMHWGDTSHLKVPRPAREDSPIARKRVENNLTQTQLAELLHTTRQTVSHWECGAQMPSVRSLLQLSEALHCTVDELLR